MLLRFVCLIVLLILSPAVSAQEAPVRLGLVKFGTVAWEADVIRHNGLDVSNGIHLSVTEFATNEAAKVALQAQAVDLIMTDWPWVARQQAEGTGLRFAPSSKAVGALIARPGSNIATLADLKGKRIGVVGGPLDKSWLLLRALSRREIGADLGDLAEPVFGAPPLLGQELSKGRIDAVLTYWHDAARLQAEGAKLILSVSEIVRLLGDGRDVPMLGFAFHEDWAQANQDAIEGFLKALRQAKILLATSDAEWMRLTPLLGTEDPRVKALLKAGYRAGVVERWDDEERQNAARLYDVLVELGGERLVGRSTTLDPGIFWPTRPE